MFFVCVILFFVKDCYSEETTTFADINIDGEITTIDPILQSILGHINEHSLLETPTSKIKTIKGSGNMSNSSSVFKDTDKEGEEGFAEVPKEDIFTENMSISRNLDRIKENQQTGDNLSRQPLQDSKKIEDTKPNESFGMNASHETSFKHQTEKEDKNEFFLRNQSLDDDILVDRLGLSADSNTNQRFPGPVRRVVVPHSTFRGKVPVNLQEPSEPFLDAWRPVWPFQKVETAIIRPTVRFPSIELHRSKVKLATELISTSVIGNSVIKQPVTAYYFDISSTIPSNAPGPLHDPLHFNEQEHFQLIPANNEEDEELNPLVFPQESSHLQSSFDSVRNPSLKIPLAIEATPTLQHSIKSVHLTTSTLAPSLTKDSSIEKLFVRSSLIPVRSNRPPFHGNRPFGNTNGFQVPHILPIGQDSGTGDLNTANVMLHTVPPDGQPTDIFIPTGDFENSFSDGISNASLLFDEYANLHTALQLTTNLKDSKLRSLSRIPLWKRISQQIATLHSLSSLAAPSSTETPASATLKNFRVSSRIVFENEIPLNIFSPHINRNQGAGNGQILLKSSNFGNKLPTIIQAPVLESSFASPNGNDQNFDFIDQYGKSFIYSTRQYNVVPTSLFTKATLPNTNTKSHTSNPTIIPKMVFVNDKVLKYKQPNSTNIITSGSDEAVTDLDFTQTTTKESDLLTQYNLYSKLFNLSSKNSDGLNIVTPRSLSSSFGNSTVGTKTNEVFPQYDERDYVANLGYSNQDYIDAPLNEDEYGEVYDHNYFPKGTIVTPTPAVHDGDIFRTQLPKFKEEMDLTRPKFSKATVLTEPKLSEGTSLNTISKADRDQHRKVSLDLSRITTATPMIGATPLPPFTTDLKQQQPPQPTHITTTEHEADTMSLPIPETYTPTHHPNLEGTTPQIIPYHIDETTSKLNPHYIESERPSNEGTPTDSTEGLTLEKTAPKVIVFVEKPSGSEPQLHLLKMHQNGTNVTQSSPYVKAAVAYDIREFCEHRKSIQSLFLEWINKHYTNTSDRQPYEIEIFDQPDCKDVYLLEDDPSIGTSENRTDLYFYVKENGEINPNLTINFPKNPTAFDISEELKYLKNKVLHLELVNVPPTEEDLLIEEAAVGTSIIIIVIVSSLLVVLLIAAILAFILIKRRKSVENVQGRRCTPAANDAYSLDSVSVFYHSIKRKSKMRASNKSLKSYLNQGVDDPNGPSRQLSFAKLTQAISDNEELYEEFANLPVVMPKYDDLPKGVEDKNRYANVIPILETRILLNNKTPSTEYINANSVHGPKGELRYYIATQAPRDNTVPDFWQMVWEQESKVIVMLTDYVEKGMDKCSDYLPPSETLDCHRVYGEFQITLKSRDLREKYVVSIVQIKNLENNLVREIAHMWFTGWPHTGIPADEKSFITFIFDVRATRKQFRAKGPLVVHCSPGTGRTGTYIACDLAMKQFEDQKVIDIPKTVFRIRRERAGAVQTKEQFAFIYRVVYLYAAKLTTGNLDSF